MNKTVEMMWMERHPEETGLLIYGVSFQKQIQPQHAADTSLKSSVREGKKGGKKGLNRDMVKGQTASQKIL